MGSSSRSTPEAIPLRRAVRIEVHSGEDSFTPDRRFQLKENQGYWYAPYLASLITSGGRLLLALLEKSVNNAGGTHAWAVFTGIAGGGQNRWEFRIRALRLLLARMSILDRTRHTGRGTIL